MRRRTPRARLEAAAAVLLGVAGFFTVVGPRVLDPTNIAWLRVGDPAKHFLGWEFYRHAEWSFPIGLNPHYGPELRNAIVFTDSIPLLAFAVKPFSSHLSEPFQFFGVWVLACFVLQAWFAWKLVGLVSGTPAVRLLGAGLFVFAPPMLWRLQGHLALVGHFPILAALYLSLRGTQDRRGVLWAAVLVASALVQAYLLAMVALLWLADVAQRTLDGGRPARAIAAELVGVLAALGIVCWQAGYFEVGGDVGAAGFGHYRMNLLSIVDPSGWSYVLRDIPDASGEYEGFNYLGLGVIVLALFGVPALIARRAGLSAHLRRRPFLLAALTGLFLFALSHTIGIGPLQVELPVVDGALRAAQTFRSSGRMFWPVYYVLVLTAVFVVARGCSPRVATALLGIALVVQVADTRARWSGIRGMLMTEPAAAWETPLISDFWTRAAARYRTVRRIPSDNHCAECVTLAAYAGRHGLATDAVSLTRVNDRKLARARRKGWATLTSGQYQADSLYVVDPGKVRLAALTLDPTTDLLARIDGFHVVAPGWKRCPECGPAGEEVRVTDVLPPVQVGTRISFSRSAGSTAYLVRGWSEPDDRGVLAIRRTAEVALPLGSDAVRGIVIEAYAAGAPGRTTQRVAVGINGSPPEAVDLPGDGGIRVELPIPDAARPSLAQRSVLRVTFRMPDTTGDDPAVPTLRLAALTVR